jgi:APA family basic amino acid/polyamine antiporter
VPEEQLAFARKASGLVRGLSMMDAFGVGFMNQGLTPSIWVVVSLGLSVFMGANLIIATVISVVLAGIGFPIVWGVLGGSMPRSGGEYIYNSRILHPVVGLAQSFGDAVIWLMWIYVLAPLAVDPGLTTTFQFVGWQGGANWLQGANYREFLVATLLNIIGFLFVVFGIKIFARAQKIVMFFGIGGCAVLGFVLSFTSKATFINKWNAFVDKAGSANLHYNHFATVVGHAAGTTVPTTWNWTDTFGVMVAMSWLFAYAYSISFIAGEVKRPDKTIIMANLFAIIVPAVFMFWFAWALVHSVGFQFLSASGYADQNGIGAISKLPWSTSIMGLGAVMAGTSTIGRILSFLGGLSYVAFTLWWLALSYLAFPRIIFAWGMDRMGPKWFTDVSPRYASPVKNHVLCLAISEILLAIYFFWLTNTMQNITVTGMQITSVFAVTAIAAAVFPYSKKAKGIWEASPYRRWTFLGLPVVTWGGIVDLVYLFLLLYFFIFKKAAGAFTVGSTILFVAVWVLGILWYFFWRQRSKSVGVDVSVTYGELPPE